MNALYAVQTLELSDGWIGAGFVRDAVWDHLHGYGQRPVSGDVDVVWFDAKSGSAADDRALEERLSQQSSAFNWSVKNQARMHQRNGNKPYHSTENALLYWPETATAIAVRMGRSGLIEVIAPYGAGAICLHSVCRPTPVFAQHKLAIFSQRVAEKRWLPALSRPAADCPDLSRFRHHCGLTLISCHIPGQRADFPAMSGQISCTLTLIDYTLMAGCAASGGCRSGVAEPTSWKWA